MTHFLKKPLLIKNSKQNFVVSLFVFLLDRSKVSFNNLSTPNFQIGGFISLSLSLRLHS